MNRNSRARLGQETVEIVERGWYDSPGGGRVDLSPLVSQCLASTTLYRPSKLDDVVHCTAQRDTAHKTSFEVVNETSLSASRRLVSQHGGSTTLCLNFASAKNPGGGFLGGSQAQEESLARSSGLYASLVSQTEYYEANRACRTALYTDHMILSPGVPVFRDDAGTLLEAPHTLGIVTAPAVNAGAVRKNETENAPRIWPTMAARIAKVLALAAHHGYENLVLGAWGCGVFKNDPSQIATLFADALLRSSRFRDRFRFVVFAVLDGSGGEEIIGPFRTHFGARIVA
jgi:uncharacterized protein (TIGR02452 family)